MCSQIPFFEKACKEGVFKVRFPGEKLRKGIDIDCLMNKQEGHERMVDLSHDECPAINAMIQYAYAGDYESEDHINPGSQALFHVQVYAIASKYNLSGSQEIAGRRFEPVVKKGCYDLYDSCYSRDHHLRDIVVEIMIEHQPAFAAKGDENMMDDLLEELGAFARDCFARLSKKTKDEQEKAFKDTTG
ncbi:uncharacterized protein BDZ99DRAFT_527819 [Mytilinidion resinicola]|uniref:BTB domain-containing protein n=1 Tax=Mytilinidion resinicola TaxID=574789 RepID=A0A6A6Y012_9PEZI|nr:uncharacterized protein BDZ99DRAFT_527819 [Mytilinidion resinicola]KAF2802156.1 hypothetical protein BDZ99DRAFT_527819 [Mytilinidion resinicola]